MTRRANDLVLISAVEALLKAGEIAHFIADQHMSALEGSLGFMPRRVLVLQQDAAQAREILAQAGLAGELRDG